MIKPRSKDPRENGKIFSVEARKKEISEFEIKFIGTKTSFDDRLRCGFLWADGDRTTGRGMGKTALAIYMKHRINEGFGSNYFGGKTRFFCIYISFGKQIKSKIDYLYKAAFVAMDKEGIFQEIARTVSKEDLIKANIDEDFADAIVNNKVKMFLEQQSRYKLEEMYTQWDQKFLVKLPDLFLNQTIKTLQAAGFAGGIVVLDDLENLTDISTRKEIETFIKDFGLAFFRNESVATNDNFFSFVLTTHLQSAQKISEAWKVAGLSASYDLNEKGPASILTRRPDLDQCIDMVGQHIKYYRSGSANSDQLHPFERDAIETVIKETSFHPRKFLSRFNRILTSAAGDKVQKIGIDYVNTVAKDAQEEEESLGIEDL